MRRIVLSLTMLATAGPLQAGVYNLDAPSKYPKDYVETHVAQPLEMVVTYLNELRAIQDSPLNLRKPPEAGSLRESYLKQLAYLESRRQEGVLDTEDRVNLSACLIRLGRYPKAQELLEESLRLVSRDSPYHVLFQLNLAAVCQEDDSLLQRAVELQRQALDGWPALLPGWSRQECAWFHHVEQYVLTLMKLRNFELIRRRGQPNREHLPPDKLFPREDRDESKVQFVGADGEYEAGVIAWKQAERLPADADQIVLQLLLWRPQDPRLRWLYGELQNAAGQIEWAHYILYKVREIDEWRNRELEKHIRILSDALPSYRVLFTDGTQPGEYRRNQALLLWQLSPRGSSLRPGVGEACYDIGGMAMATYGSVEMGNPAPPAADVPAAPASMALPDWRHLTVSFVTGMIVSVLGVLQWQQWRRHRSLLVNRES